MALRVLLADESATIKKVIQLSLQDFGVEVKSVPIGLDVQQVARSFNPDIIFADVLLSKKNGYEVCAELKNDPSLSKIPIVLMWSGFMELDESKAKLARADRRLEKPFDADTLRSMVRELVPPVQENVISNYLTFPELPAMVEEDTGPVTAPAATTVAAPPAQSKIPTAPPAPPQRAAVIPAPPTAASFDRADFSAPTEMEEPEEFQAVPLPKNRDLSQFKIELPKEDVSFDEFEEIDLSKTNIALSSGAADISLDQIDQLTELEPVMSPRAGNLTPASTSKAAAGASFSTPLSNSPKTSLSIDPVHAEQVLNSQVRQIVEEIAWKIIPDVVERVVREEIQKLMKDAERL